MTKTNNPESKGDIERLAHFLNGYLSVELLETIPCPDELQCDYDDLDAEGKRKWFEYTFHEVFREAYRDGSGFLGRGLTEVEANLLKRRIIDFFKTGGIECE